MSIEAVLGVIQASSLSRAIAHANHLFMASLQIVHVIGFILLLSSLVVISLRVLGVVFNQTPLAAVAADMLRLLWFGLILAALSGLVMFIGAPNHYYSNPAFTTKMVLLVIAVLVQAVIFRRVATTEHPPIGLARAGVALAVLCWFSVSMAGRAIGFV